MENRCRNGKIAKLDSVHVQDGKRQIENIIVPKYKDHERKNSLTPKNICGCDTETIEGKAFLMDIFNGSEHYTFELKSFNDFLRYYFSKEFENSINFFHNLQFDYQAILKHLSIEQLNFIAQHDRNYYMINPKGETQLYNKYDEFFNNEFLKGFEIRVIPRKLFMIAPIVINDGIIQFKKSGKIALSSHRLKFYDLAQFYNFRSLDYLAKKYKLTAQKIEVEDIEHIDYNRFKNNKEYHQLIINRIQSDTEITYNLAQIIYNNVWKIQPCNVFYSVASISQALLNNYMKKHNIPKQVLQYFLWAYSGGRFECFKRGFFDNITEIDINSAYPYQIKDLIQIDKNGYWFDTNDYDLNSMYGAYYIKINVDENYISPLKYNIVKPLSYPNGNLLTWIDKNELELLIKHGFDFKILKGIEYKTPEIVKPFKFVEDLYQQKLDYKGVNPELYHTVKIILNAIYGKFIQLKPILKIKKMEREYTNDFDELIDAFSLEGIEMGVYNHTYMAGACFNPVYGSFITSGIRCKLYNDCLQYDKNLIGLQTDSIILNSSNIDLSFGNHIGEYEIKQKNVKGVVLGSGINQIGDTTKFRGFNTNLVLIDALENCKNDGTKVLLDLKRFTKLKESFRQSELNYEMINIPRKIKKELDINNDKKRKWLDTFKTPHEIFNKIIDSEPLFITN